MSAATIASYKGALALQGPAKQPDRDATLVPVGLDFGPTWISTAFSIDESRIDEHGHDEAGDYSNGFPCGQVYRDFYQEALSKKMQSHLDFHEPTPSGPLVPTEERASELVQAFARHIEEARLMGVWALDNNPMFKFKVMAITVPEHWDISARTVVAKAARLAGQPLDGSYMMLKLPRAVQSAYEMHKYTAGKYLTLLVHYHKSHLHLMLVQMCGSGCVMKGQVYLPHLGEVAIRKAVESNHETLSKYHPGDNLSSEEPTSDESDHEATPDRNLLHDDPLPDIPPQDTPLHDDSLHGNPLTGNSITEEKLNDNLTPEPSTSTASPDDINTKPPVYQTPLEYLKPIQEALLKFTLLMTRSDDSNTASESSPLSRPAFKDVEYVVIDGEATSRGEGALRTAIEEMFVDMTWVNVEGNISDCGALGAKIAALRQLENPKHLGDWKDLPGYLPEKAT